MRDPLFDEDYNLWIMLNQARDTMWVAREKELNKLGLSVMETAAMFVIQVIERTADRRATVAEISRWIFRKPHSTSELISRMEKKGLVEKVKDPGTPHGHRSRIVLTEKALEIYQQTLERPSIHGIVSSLSEEERHTLWLCLGKLRNRGLKEGGILDKPPFPQFL